MKLVYLCLFLLLPLAVVGADNDSLLVEVKANLINIDTGEPVLSAKITYQDKEDASNFGVTRVKGEGLVNFYALKGSPVVMVITAEGFRRVEQEVDPASATDGVVEMTVELVPFGVGRLMRLDNLRFQAGRATILEDSYEELNLILGMLNDNPNLVIQLEGHTDFRGNARLNKELSQERVDAVKDYLVEKGVKGSRVKLEAFGGEQPLTTANTQEGRAKNRRVEVRILAE